VAHPRRLSPCRVPPNRPRVCARTADHRAPILSRKLQPRGGRGKLLFRSPGAPSPGGVASDSSLMDSTDLLSSRIRSLLPHRRLPFPPSEVISNLPWEDSPPPMVRACTLQGVRRMQTRTPVPSSRGVDGKLVVRLVCWTESQFRTTEGLARIRKGIASLLVYARCTVSVSMYVIALRVWRRWPRGEIWSKLLARRYVDRVHAPSAFDRVLSVSDCRRIRVMNVDYYTLFPVRSKVRRCLYNPRSSVSTRTRTENMCSYLSSAGGLHRPSLRIK